MTSEVLGEMFEGDSADTCAEKFPLVSMGGRAEGLACADPGARTPIGASGISISRSPSAYWLWDLKIKRHINILSPSNSRILENGRSIPQVSFPVGSCISTTFTIGLANLIT